MNQFFGSPGMKRRALIAALAHEPELIFLDEPTAESRSLRKDMWELVKDLRSNGATIILTTHYIEEAEEIADRVGIINKGKLLVIEEKSTLMQKMGDRRLIIHLRDKITNIPQI